ncbi:EexN family lipoprotein [Campylobacter jejuni]|nr:EexN family lipoprotein [Campylobacter jejuni]EJD5856564.1 EexN family lipoprotein [Campylobacter jejuni]HED5300106.1 EexN family lipoprotein [Campylobacter jejuni]
MKNTIKLALLGAVITGVFSACSSEPKTVQYYEDPKNATELEAKIKECANAYKANYSKSFQKPRESAMEFFKNNK